MRIVPLGLLLAALVLPEIARAGAVERLKAFVDGTRAARGAFTQTAFTKSGKKPQQASGTMMFVRPGKFRWVYDQPYQQVLVGDGEKLWIWDKDLNQVTVKRIGKALGDSPAAFLAGEGDLERHFTIIEVESRDGMEWAEARPKAPETSFERLRLGFRGEALQVMEILDNFGQTTVLVFAAIERNPPLPPALFRFTPPKGADVVGE